MSKNNLIIVIQNNMSHLKAFLNYQLDQLSFPHQGGFTADQREVRELTCSMHHSSYGWHYGAYNATHNR